MASTTIDQSEAYTQLERVRMSTRKIAVRADCSRGEKRVGARDVRLKSMKEADDRLLELAVGRKGQAAPNLQEESGSDSCFRDEPILVVEEEGEAHSLSSKIRAESESLVKRLTPEKTDLSAAEISGSARDQRSLDAPVGFFSSSRLERACS